jgi:hypothetical protein
LLFFRKSDKPAFALLRERWDNVSAAKSAGKQKETTRKWRRKPLKSPKTDSEMAPTSLAVGGKEKVAQKRT